MRLTADHDALEVANKVRANLLPTSLHLLILFVLQIGFI